MGPTPYQYLPLWARIAVEWLDNCSEMRNQAKLDELLDSYAKACGETVDNQTRESARHICRRRFLGSYREPPVAEPVPPSTLRLVTLFREGALTIGDTVATQRLGECLVACIHAASSIEVRALATGRRYLISGLDFGPDARLVAGGELQGGTFTCP